MLAALDTTPPRAGIRVSASPVQPHEAIDFFGRKAPLTKDQWLRLGEDARKRAFTAAWVTDVRVLQSVKDSLDGAIKDGESFDSWKKRIRAELGERWKRSDPYLETVFRNNVQSAYAAGRYKAQTTPTILRLRPFWRLVVLLDGRTSPYCAPLANPPVILPAEHPWWATGYPPRHTRCRAATVTLTRRQAERLGVSPKAPGLVAQKGWGSTAGLGEWQPSGESVDRTIFEAARRGATDTPPIKVEAPSKIPEIRAASPLGPEALRKRGVYVDHAGELKRTVRKVFGDSPPDIADIESTYSAAGITAAIKSVAVDRDIETIEEAPLLRIAFKLLDRDGQIVGDMTREFTRGRAGLAVKHLFVELHADARGKGYAEEVTKKSIGYYRSIGAKKIEIDAQHSGRYVWARLGFDWSMQRAERIRVALAAFLNMRGMSNEEADRVSEETSRHPWLVAAITHKGKRLGKEFLLSEPGWKGALDLGGGPGYEQAAKRLKL